MFDNSLRYNCSKLEVTLGNNVEERIEGLSVLAEEDRKAAIEGGLFYVCISDDGDGINPEWARNVINPYLFSNEDAETTSGLSTRDDGTGGGKGTELLKLYSQFQGTTCFYQPTEKGTDFYMIFKKREIA